MKSGEFAAKTVDLAIEEGLKELGVTREKADIEILSAGGFLSKAKVKITVKYTGADKALDFVENVLKLMKVAAYIEVNEDNEAETVFNIVGSDVSKLLTKYDTIDALQYLSSLLANSGSEEYKRIVIDCDDYRKARQERLEKLADDMAQKAVNCGYRIKLEPMNPYERRVIHSKLQQNEEVTTHSEGEEPGRYLVITPKKLKSSDYSPKSYSGSSEKRDKKPYGSQGGDRRFDSRGGDRKPRENRGDKSYGDNRGFNRDRNFGSNRDGKTGDGNERKFDSRGGDRRFDSRGDRPAAPPRPKVATGSIILNPVKTEDEKTEE